MSDLLDLARGVLAGAHAGEEVEVVVGRATSTTVKVYGGEVESLTSAGTSGAGVRVIRDGRQGFAHCGSLEVDVLAETLAEARDNCSFGEPDECNGLAVPDGVAAGAAGCLVRRGGRLRPGGQGRPRPGPGAPGAGPRTPG